MIADGRVRPVIGAGCRSSRRRSAQAAPSGEVTGKIVLRVGVIRPQPSDASARTNWSTSAVVE